MKVHVSRRGNRAAIRKRPPALAATSYRLQKLLDRMQPEAFHDEVDFGSAKGREIW
jgi:antitoxin component of MazEF toxin-antitoxin module